jgi:hypothetical protein
MHRVCIEFQHSRVSVTSPSEEIVTALRRAFQHMLADEASSSLSEVEVVQDHGTYQIVGGSDAAQEDSSVGDIVRRVRYEIIRRLVDLHPELLWFHAGAAASPHGAVLLSGAWGRGKSTLVTGLCGLGWKYLSDDIAPVDPERNVVFPFPQTPMMRENPAGRSDYESLRNLPKVEVELSEDSILRHPVGIRSVIFPSFGTDGRNDLYNCAPSQAVVELLQSSLNFGKHREHAVKFLAKLVQNVPAYQLTFSDRNAAAEIVSQVAV